MRTGFGMHCEGFCWLARDVEGLGYARTRRGFDRLTEQRRRVFHWIEEVVWWCFHIRKGVLFLVAIRYPGRRM